jgi:hypothetical protein
VKARDLVRDYPTVGEHSDAVDAARLLTDQDRPGLIVLDEHDHPVAVLPGSQVLRLVIPGYIRDDRTLAGVVDDEFVRHMCDALAGKTVAELLPKDRSKLPVVGGEESLLAVAALMAAERSPIVAVVAGPGTKGPLLGTVTLRTVLTELLPDKITES